METNYNVHHTGFADHSKKINNNFYDCKYVNFKIHTILTFTSKFCNIYRLDL